MMFASLVLVRIVEKKESIFSCQSTSSWSKLKFGSTLLLKRCGFHVDVKFLFSPANLTRYGVADYT